MRISFFIVALFVLLNGHSGLAQERRLAQINSLAIDKVMPKDWGDSVNCVITVTNAAGRVMVASDNKLIIGKMTFINIHSYPAGNYKMSVHAMGVKGKDSIWATNFNKTANWDFISLRMVKQCEFEAATPGQRKRSPNVDKPVIYLYPLQRTPITVQLDFLGALTTTIPEYGNGWNVVADTDGTITNAADGQKFPYLFWDGVSDYNGWDMHEGFLVKSDSSRQFLERVLPAMGLLPAEYREFIDFWLPRLQQHPYNIIHFAGKEYEAMARLNIKPAPDAVLRVFMVYQPAENNTVVHPQSFLPFVRRGFTVVEWGGMEATNLPIVKL